MFRRVMQCAATGLAFLALAGPLFAATTIDREVFARRRAKVMAALKDGVAVFRNPDCATRSNDTTYYPYRPDSDFFYLTGLEEPGAACILAPGAGKKFVLFLRPQNPVAAAWDNDRTGLEGAVRDYGADAAFPVEEFGSKLPESLPPGGTVFYDFRDRDLGKTILDRLPRRPDRMPAALADLARIVHAMRMVKGPEEIERIRRAVDITCQAQAEALAAIRPGITERAVEAVFSQVFETSGASDKAFETLIASGPNATVIHYVTGPRQTRDGEMILMDMGAEYEHYAADITRVAPVNGKFSEEQRNLYELAVKMEETAIAGMKPGARTADIEKAVEEVAREGLFALGLITDRNTKWQHLLYYFPIVGHGVGLDVHDVCVGREDSLPLQPGMVFAVEPMVYAGDNLVALFRLKAARECHVSEGEIDAFLQAVRPVFERYRNIPGRIEDDVLITESGNEVLSARLPRRAARLRAR